MMHSEDSVRVWDQPAWMGKAVVFVQKRGDKYFIAKPVELVYEEVARCAQITPTLLLTQEQSIALVDQIQNTGVRTPTDEKRDGKLEAMSAHLADLRQLLKLK